MARKTEAQKREEREERTRAECERFIKRFEKARTLLDAWEIVGESSARSGQPGREFYSNLGFFLHAFTVPAGSAKWEREMYLAFLRRLDADGGLNPGSLQALEGRLVEAIAAKGPFAR